MDILLFIYIIILLYTRPLKNTLLLKVVVRNIIFYTYHVPREQNIFKFDKKSMLTLAG